MKVLNYVLIQNDKILLIFLCLQAKLWLFQDYRALLLCASSWEFFALKIFKKSRTNEAENRQKINNSQSLL